ncbi:MAG: NAD(P)/FAD-dependent oxidoreductase [Chloroflexota bacterium]
MSETTQYDAVIVGSGPNGLAAAVTLAQAGRSVLVLEGKETIGGGMRTLEYTLPGYRHDVCSAVHPLGVASPFFRELQLREHGLEWVFPELPLVHLLNDRSVALHQSIEETAAGLGRDGDPYRRLFEPIVDQWRGILEEFLGPLGLPRRPLLMARFGLRAIQPAATLANHTFATEEARALFAGMAAHITIPLEKVTTAAGGLMLGMLAHAIGWPFARGGSQSIATALASYLRALGGEIRTGIWVRSMRDIPPARVVLFDLTPRDLLTIVGEELPAGYRKRLAGYRYGQGVFKVDWALSEPVPWRDPPARRAGTLHIGGTLPDIAAGERAIWNGRLPDPPYVLFAQPSVFDPTRTPQGSGEHVAWAYCHVPPGSTADMTAAIEARIERHAPGFGDCIIGRHTINAAEYEAYNPNYPGGDINSGVQDWRQLFTRPVARLNPYTTPNPRLFICSAATPPGGGVHGMCGYHAAQTVLRRRF